MKIPLIKPFIDDNVKQKINEVLDSGFLTEGSVTKEFENDFSKYIGCKHSIAVTSCTTGLEIALRAIGIGQGDEVIVPDYTYPATAAVVSIVGAKTVIVDIDNKNLLINYDAIEDAITERTKAIIPVSLFGNPLNYSRLNEIKKKYNLFIIEDAACSIGAEMDGAKVGTMADITVFSFHPRKFITTGEGGMVTTDNKDWAEWINSYKHFGMQMNNSSRENIHFEIIGTNYKLSNVLSAIGISQLKLVDELLRRRRLLAKNYIDLIREHDRIELPAVCANGSHSYQSFCILINNRAAVMNRLRSDGIEVQIGSYALHMHPAFQNPAITTIKGDMRKSEDAFNRTLALPLYHDLRFEEQRMIIDEIVKII